ncbi:MAG: hypothetical protein GVY32_13035 [Gammaproteobacteria bacterium]|jgi:hypothetical protein|nr:hypothetical protein [Gammaproteobacteria bacterium]
MSLFSETGRGLCAALLGCLLTVNVLAQEVHVFDQGQPQDGSTILKETGPDESVRLLVIPVVTADTAFDPDANELDAFSPGLKADLESRFEQTDDFWREASYGQVGATAKVLPRFYHMPRGQEFYVNPAFQDVQIRTDALAVPVDVPAGQFKIKARFTSSDTTTYTVSFEAGDGPFATLSDLRDHINTQLGTDRLEAVSDGSRLNLRMEARRVRAGSYVVIDWDGSDDDVLEALRLDAPAVDEPAGELTGRVGAWPVNVTVNSELTLRILHEDGATEDFVWVISGGSSYADASAFAAAHNGDLADAGISVDGDRVVFDLSPSSAEAIEAIVVEASSSVFPLADLGLVMPRIQHGLVSSAATNTVRGNRRLILGQAVAAYMLNEMTRDHGSDDIPDIAFDAGNEAALTDAFQENVDYDGTPDKPFNSYVVVFLDIVGKRAGASGGFIDAGVDDGGYLFTHQSYGTIQIIYAGTSVGTVAHETGHNYGFPDLYNNSPGNYDPNLLYPRSWDIMHQSALNQPGAWAKFQRSDWLVNDGNVIQSFPMPDMPGTESRRYAITPLDFSRADYDDGLTGVPGDVDAVTKALRLPLGFDEGSEHHYMLLQNRQQTATSNAGIPMSPGATARGGLYLTDTITHKVFDYFTITTRNYVHPLTDRAPVSSTAGPIIDRDPMTDIAMTATYPAYAGLTIDLVDEIPGPAGLADKPTYIVEVNREQSDFLDLSIEPWGAPPWETSDIWIEHGDKDEADLSTEPLPGNGEPARWAEDYDPAANDGKPLNWIRVRISNQGTVDATDVQLKVKVNSPGAMGDKGSWIELDLSEARTVAAGGDTIFSVPWNPKVKGHTCIQVEIFRWNAPLGDLDLTNNGTQENINDFRPTAGSPWHPKPFSVDIFNPFDQELEVYLEMSGLLPGFSVDWDASYLVLSPRSKVTATGVMHIDDAIVPVPEPDGSGGIQFYRMECREANAGSNSSGDFTSVAAAGDPIRRDCRKVPGKPIRQLMHVAGLAYAGDYRVPIGGVTYNVRPTIDTAIDVDVTRRGSDVLVRGSTRPTAAGQDMEVEVRYPSGRFEWIPVRTDAEGAFEARFPPKEDGKASIAVNYPDGGDFAPVRVGGMLFDPESPADEAGWCASCQQTSIFWILNFVLLGLVLLIVLIIWIRQSRASKV